MIHTTIKSIHANFRKVGNVLHPNAKIGAFTEIFEKKIGENITIYPQSYNWVITLPPQN